VSISHHCLTHCNVLLVTSQTHSHNKCPDLWPLTLKQLWTDTIEYKLNRQHTHTLACSVEVYKLTQLSTTKGQITKGSLSLISLFSTNTAISETKCQGWRVILLPSEGRLAIYQPQPLPPFCSAAIQKVKGSEAHLNYYASAYNKERQISHRKTKLHKQQQNAKKILTIS